MSRGKISLPPLQRFGSRRRFAFLQIRIPTIFALLIAVSLSQYAPAADHTNDGKSANQYQMDCNKMANAKLVSDYVHDWGRQQIVAKPSSSTPGVIAPFRNTREHHNLVQGLITHLKSQCLTEMGFRHYDGFFIRAPAGEGWEIVRNPKLGIPISFLKKIGADVSGAGESHTVGAAVTFSPMESAPQKREETLQLLVQGVKGELFSDARYRLVAFDWSDDQSRGADCIGYTAEAEDSGVPGYAGSVFTHTTKGVRCVHQDRWIPSGFPRAVVGIEYTQRYLNGRWISAFDAEVTPFLQSLIFTSLHPYPYVIGSFEQYASLLRDMQQENKAQAIQNLADRLREPLKVGVRSLDIKQELRDYATLLRGVKRESEAAEIETLADRYSSWNFEQFLSLQQKTTGTAPATSDH